MASLLSSTVTPPSVDEVQCPQPQSQPWWQKERNKEKKATGLSRGSRDGLGSWVKRDAYPGFMESGYHETTTLWGKQAAFRGQGQTQNYLQPDTRNAGMIGLLKWKPWHPRSQTSQAIPRHAQSHCLRHTRSSTVPIEVTSFQNKIECPMTCEHGKV